MDSLKMKKMNRFNAIALAFAILVAIVGLAFIWIGGQVSRLSCTRLESGLVDCQLQRHFLGFFPTGHQVLSQVSGSEVKEDCFDDCRYWIELLTGKGPVRLTGFSSYSRPGVMADEKRLKEFLSNPNLKSFEHIGSPSWTMLVASMPLIVVGSLLAVSYGKRLYGA